MDLECDRNDEKSTVRVLRGYKKDWEYNCIKWRFCPSIYYDKIFINDK